VLESRLRTSHRHLPYFALDAGADEEHGDIWFGALAWSGAWKISAEATEHAATRLGIGLNDWDFAWELAPGETFRTPPVLAGFSADGFGGASRLLHDYIRPRLPHGEQPHPVLYNSWEAALFDIDEGSETRLAEIATGLGVELFVVDDGWFHGRDNDTTGLGDWWPDERKFPRSLGPLIERVNRLGMGFGLWIEPEMVNPNSELYRKHPDWAIHFPNRPRTEARNQLVLNLARTDVQEYLIGQLDWLLGTHNIAFIKWDMNRAVSEPGWTDAPRDQRELWVRYVQGLYRVWGELCVRYPKVVWQSCASGGGRADLGILRFADQIWTSDNTIPTSRLEIQHGFSQLFPAITMEGWVTDMGPAYGASDLPLSFRFHVSMCGVLGIGVDLLKWSDAERREASHWVALYKEIRPIVQFGDQYRLCSPLEGPFSAVEYVSKDRCEAVLFAFRTHQARLVTLPMLRLRGLEPEARYAVEGLEEVRSGAAWMRLGIDLVLGDFQSIIRRIRQV
jgi:alpha-galactosidase